MAPRTEEQYEAIRQQSREVILTAALELFARNGFHNTSISQIAGKAGFSKGLIYNYFESKEQLLQIILEQAIQMGEEVMQDEDLEKADMSVVKMIRKIFGLIRQNPHYWKLLLALSMHEDIMQRFQHIIKPQQEHNCNRLIRLLEEKGIKNAKMEALTISALLDGILIQYIHMRDRYPMDEMEDFLSEKFKNY